MSYPDFIQDRQGLDRWRSAVGDGHDVVANLNTVWRFVETIDRLEAALREIAAGNFNCARHQYFMAAQGRAEAALGLSAHPGEGLETAAPSATASFEIGSRVRPIGATIEGVLLEFNEPCSGALIRWDSGEEVWKALRNLEVRVKPPLSPLVHSAILDFNNGAAGFSDSMADFIARRVQAALTPSSETLAEGEKGTGASVADIARTGPLPRPDGEALPVGKGDGS